MEIACALVPEPLLRAAGDERRLPVEDVWEDELRRLEGIGAALESERPGEAFFSVDGLRGIHGGGTAGVAAAARGATRLPARIGVAPTRFAAFIAAGGDEEKVVPAPRLREFLAGVPVAALTSRLGLAPRESEDLDRTMARLGIGTLGDLAALAPAQVADRFGPAGLRALEIARGEEGPLRVRRPHEELAAEIELPEGTAGSRLDHALELLVDRLLAAPQRRNRTLLALRLGATLGADGGSWSVEQGLGRPSASARVLRTVLAPRLEALPAPAVTLRLRALALGPPVGDQMELSIRGQEQRRRRLGEAVREVRAAQGAESLLRILQVDPASRVPERRAILTPFPSP
jgi:protein ImuB